jgi:hypothetical protein
LTGRHDNFIGEMDYSIRGKRDLLRERDELTKEKDDFIRGKEVSIEKELGLKGRCRNWRGIGQGMRLASHDESRGWRSCNGKWTSLSRSHSNGPGGPVAVAAPAGRVAKSHSGHRSRSRKPGHGGYEIVGWRGCNSHRP